MKDDMNKSYKIGMPQGHYAQMQSKILQEIEELRRSLEHNELYLKSCKECNLIFHKDHLLTGVCEKCWSDQEKLKKEKVDLVFYLMAKCDMINGRIMDMTKEDIDDTWYLQDMDDIILMGQKTCSESRREGIK